MSSAPSSPTFDYERMAADFDRFLPFLEPVTSVLLERLPKLPAGARVLDVACGMGEPALSLARRHPGVQVLGIDAAAAMIEIARAKAGKEQIANASFEATPAETLTRATRCRCSPTT